MERTITKRKTINRRKVLYNLNLLILALGKIINIVTQDENICPVCGASIKPEYSNWNDCYEYYNWECQQCEAKGTAVYKMIRNFEEHIDIEKGEQL